LGVAVLVLGFFRDYGFEPIAVETPAGRAEYVRAQQSVAERAAPLRAILADRCDLLLGTAGEPRITPCAGE